jgi:hypothetical protein
MDAGCAGVATGRGRGLTATTWAFRPFPGLWMNKKFLDQIDRLRDPCKRGIDTQIDA